ncbi:MAG: DUF1385 domain-containing protein [Lachnospiraceae bacterium]|nr:DUF1385 domain-containing protein [Lachnospiraceae bacterium]
MGKKRRKQSSGLTEKPLFEGVLIKNANKYTLETRKSDGELQTVVKNAEANPDKLIKKIPFVRGVFVLFQDVLLTLESLEFSAEYFANDSSKETIIDKALGKVFGKHTNIIVSAFAACVSFILCLFFVTAIPIFLSGYLKNYIVNDSVIHIIEFAAYIIIMVVYMLSFLLFKDIRRMLKYHSAAHKVINCVERGRKPTFKNVSLSSRYLYRCTTDYIVFCTLVSLVLFVFVRIDSIPLRLLFRVLYIPIATGLFYELYNVICLLPDNWFRKILSLPAVIIQVLYLPKPDDEMIKTAIASMEAVFDWREFLVINFPEKYSSDDFKNASEKKKSIEEMLLVKEEIEDQFDSINEELTREEQYEEIDVSDRDNYPEEEFVISEEEYYPEEEFEISEEEYYSEEIEGSGEEYYAEGTAEEEGNYEYTVEGSYDEEPLTEEELTEVSYAEETENEDDLTEEAYMEDSKNKEDSYIEGSETGERSGKETYSEDSVNEDDTTEETDGSFEKEPVSDKAEKKETVTNITRKEFRGYSNSDDSGEEFEEVRISRKEVEELTKTQPVSIDFLDDYGFDPDDEEVPENEQMFEPVNEDDLIVNASDKNGIPYDGGNDDDYEGNVPLFSKEIESIPMPDRLDNIVEYIPEGGMTSRIYNLNPEEAERNELYDDDDEDIDFDNIIDENGHLTLKNTDAFNRKLDEEYDEIFKRLGLDSDDL